MKILALETSCDQGSVALLSDGCCSQVLLDDTANHSGRVLAAIRELLDGSACSVGELDGIAFGSGPGAFTGLRLGCGVAQGLALAGNLRVFPVSSLAALAAAQGDGLVLAMTDARMGEVYGAAFRVASGMFPEVLSEPVCTTPDLYSIPRGADWVCVGSAFQAYGDLLLSRMEAASAHVDPGAVPRAEWVARLAGMLFEAGGRDPQDVAPTYVRNKVALTTAERLARGGRV